MILLKGGMTWDLSHDQRVQFLELMNSMGTNSLYRLDAVARRVRDCGIPVSVDEAEAALVIDTVKIRCVDPEWGAPGIYAPSVLDALLKVYELEFASDMSGSGFRFRDLLTQLAMHWQIDKDYT
jgi:hypothetical protein